MKNRVEVVIAGTRFTMSGEQEEAYMTKIAALVDDRVCKIKESGASMVQAALLTACDMADNYVQAAQGSENLRKQISDYLTENKNLTEELRETHAELDDLRDNAAAPYESRIGELENKLAEAEKDKIRIAELEEQLAENEKDKDTIAALQEQLSESRKDQLQIAELEGKLAETEKKLNIALSEGEKQNHRIAELRQQAAEADDRHQEDLEHAARIGRELRELREKAEENDQMKTRIEELERDLAATDHQLNDLRTRLSRLLK